MIETPTPCDLDITTATLSAWRDQALSAQEQTRIAAHVTNCAACRVRLAAFDAVGQALRSLGPTYYQERIWRGVRMQMQQKTPRRSPNVPRWVAAAAAVLIIIGVVGTFTARSNFLHGKRGGTTTPASATATATVPASVKLNWHSTPLAPWQIGPDAFQASIAIAASDGNTVYACQQPQGSNSIHLYVTHDQSVTWQRLPDVPSVANGFCSVTVDDSDAATLIISIGQGSSGGGYRALLPVTSPNGIASSPGYTSLMNNEMSTDGGKTWHEVTKGYHYQFRKFASTVLGSYASLNTGPPDNNLLMVISHDGFTSLENVTIPGSNPNNQPDTFWADKASGQVLVPPNSASVEFNTGPTLTFNDSVDGGKTWTTVTVPAYQSIDARALPNGAGWQICDVMQALQCSFDTGKTWNTIPVPNANQIVPKKLHAPFPAPTPTSIVAQPSSTAAPESLVLTLLGITPDGSVLIVEQTTNQQATKNQPGKYQSHLYREVATTAQWQYLGDKPNSPDFLPQYIHAPGNGVLWSLVNGTADDAVPSMNYVVSLP